MVLYVAHAYSTNIENTTNFLIFYHLQAFFSSLSAEKGGTLFPFSPTIFFNNILSVWSSSSIFCIIRIFFGLCLNQWQKPKFHKEEVLKSTKDTGSAGSMIPLSHRYSNVRAGVGRTAGKLHGSLYLPLRVLSGVQAGEIATPFKELPGRRSVL